MADCTAHITWTTIGSLSNHQPSPHPHPHLAINAEVPMVTFAPTSNRSGSCRLKTLIFAPSPILAPQSLWSLGSEETPPWDPWEDPVIWCRLFLNGIGHLWDVLGIFKIWKMVYKKKEDSKMAGWRHYPLGMTNIGDGKWSFIVNFPIKHSDFL